MKKNKTLAERLAPMTLAEIDALSDEEVATLMGVTPEDFATGPAWSWRDAAKAATDEYADRVLDHSKRVPLAQLRRYRQDARGGRPRLGAGDSVQVRVRLSPSQAELLDLAVTRTDKSRSELVRLALEQFLPGVLAPPATGRSSSRARRVS